MDLAHELKREHEQLVQGRSNHERDWTSIERQLSMLGPNFQVQTVEPGQRNNDRQFDITASLALLRFGAAIDSLVSPTTQRYHGLQAIDPTARKRSRVKKFCEKATEVLFARRYRMRANFQSNMFSCYAGLGAYGNMAMFLTRDARFRNNVYQPVHLSECYFAENDSGLVDTVHRRRRPTLKMMAERYGIDALPEKWRLQHEKNPFERVTVVYITKPREDYDPGRLDAKGKPWGHYVLALDDCELLEESGYDEFPWAIARYVTEASTEVYGRGPGHLALPSINTVQEMTKTQLRSGQRAVDPPVLLPGDTLMRPFDMRAGALNRGLVSMNGTPLAVPFQTNARLEWAEEMIERHRLAINDAFLVTLFRILVDEGRMITATEALLRAQEKGQLLAPTMGRTQAEFFGSLIQRELQLAWEDGELEDMPEELQESGGLQVEYTAPLNRLMRAEDAIAILRSVEALAPMANLDPNVQFVMKMPDAFREICEINGVPQRLMNTPEEVEALAAGDAQAAEQEQLIAAAPIAASALKDMVAARAQAQNSPGATPLG